MTLQALHSEVLTSPRHAVGQRCRNCTEDFVGHPATAQQVTFSASVQQERDEHDAQPKGPHVQAEPPGP